MKKKVKELEKNGVFHSQWSALMSQTRSKIGLAIVLLFVAAAVFAPLFSGLLLFCHSGHAASGNTQTGSGSQRSLDFFFCQPAGLLEQVSGI